MTAIVHERSSGGRLVHLGSLLAIGKLERNIAGRLPLAEAAAAHELVENSRAIGNVVLELHQVQ